MEKCKKFMDMLSAYADGELTAPEARQVEGHLNACRDCAALLETYREISAAANQSLEPPPDALRVNVMEKINAEPNPFKIKQKAKKRMILTRYMPLAACLVAAVLMWGLFGNYFSSRNVGTGGDPAPAAQAPAIDDAINIEVHIAADADEALPADMNAEPEAVPEAEPGNAGGRAIDARSAGDTRAEEAAGFSKITADEAVQIMSETGQYAILDVRTEEEYSQLRIKDAVLIPHTEIGARIGEQVPDTGTTIFVYCRTGVRSAMAAGELAGMGYTRVYDIGGITSWPYETEGD